MLCSLVDVLKGTIGFFQKTGPDPMKVFSGFGLDFATLKKFT